MIKCLEDSGSQVTLVTNRLVESLGLTTLKGNLTLSGVGSQKAKFHSKVLIHVQPEHSKMFFPIQAHTIPKISNHSPAFDIDEVKRKYSHLRDVEVKLDDESIIY